MLDNTTGSTRVPALNRRTLLKTGAWAAPVLVLAAAVPAARASETWSADVLDAPTFAVNSYVAGEIGVALQIRYDFNSWGSLGTAPATPPALATVAWKVTASGPETVDIDSGTETIGSYESTDYRFREVAGLPAGQYVVRLEATATFSPNPVDGVTFAAPPLEEQVPLSVA